MMNGQFVLLWFSVNYVRRILLGVRFGTWLRLWVLFWGGVWSWYNTQPQHVPTN